MHTLPTLYDEVNRQLILLNEQIAVIEAELQIERVPYDVKPVEGDPKRHLRMRLRDGQYILAPLYVARAQCLVAMANIRVETNAQRRAQR